MNNLKELDRFAKDIKLIKENDDLKFHYPYWIKVSKWKAEIFLNIIPSNNIRFKKIIELGSGYGLILKDISAKLKPSITIGVDNSEVILKMARKLNPNISFFNADVCNLKFENNSFDLVILSDIIEHMEHPEKLLKESQRISKYALMKIPLEKCLRTINRGYGVDDSAGHWCVFNEKEALNLLEKSGYKISRKVMSNGPKDVKNVKQVGIKNLKFLIYRIKNLLCKHGKRVYTYIFGNNLFVFCERIKD